jgi:hypothetical protein
MLMRRWLPLLLAILPASSGCGGEAESAPGEQTRPFGQALNPWDTIPPDSLYGATPVENLRLTPVELDVFGIPPGWEGMRIAAISDLQLGLWSGNEEVARAAVAAAAASPADIVVLLGDYLAEGTDVSRLGPILAPLRQKPTFAVLGDRDVRSDSLAANIRRTLTAAGIRVLNNSALPLARGGDTATIAGLSPDLVRDPLAEQRWIISQLGGAVPKGILLAHNPILAAQGTAGRFPAALAGNTFCGTVEVPGTPRLSWLNQEGLPGAMVEGTQRLYRLANLVLFVTCGTGYGFVPVRYGSPPEVALITLRSVAAEAEEAPDTVVVDTLIEQYEQSVADSAAN